MTSSRPPITTTYYSSRNSLSDFTAFCVFLNSAKIFQKFHFDPLFSGSLTLSPSGSLLTKLIPPLKAAASSYNKCVNPLTHIPLSSNTYKLMTNLSSSILNSGYTRTVPYQRVPGSLNISHVFSLKTLRANLSALAEPQTLPSAGSHHT